ncbi:MAG: alpha/beta fold hydrolase [Actinomycetota bacterium]|nr:MAG: alpha/beta fold hydrolase [Actinomycetota bacterium]
MKSRIGSIELNYVVDGDPNLPWLIFSNSVATDTSLWSEQIPPLSSRFHCLRYDHRGHGLSDATNGKYSIEMLSEDLLALMDSLRIAKASLVGISMGGMTVLTLAKRHPERIDKLVVCDCGPAASPASARQWLDRIDLVSAGGMDAIVDETIGRWFTKETLAANSPIVEKVSRMIRSTSVSGFRGSANALSTFDLRPDLANLKVPTLFIAGEQDAVVGGTRVLSETVPNSKFVAIPNAGHLCNLENPVDFVSALTEFL